MKNKAKKISAWIIITVILFVTAVISPIQDEDATGQVFAAQFADEKVYSNAAIEDNFAEDTVLVVLNRQETRKFKKYDKTMFPEIGVEQGVMPFFMQIYCENVCNS
jgi:hypothetical protein